MVSRFIQYQEINGLSKNASEHHPAFFASGQHPYFLFDIIARKHKGTEQITQVADASGGKAITDFIPDCVFW